MKKQIDMVNGNLISGMIRFSIPLILSSLLQIFYNMADTFIVGVFDDPLSMGAVSASGTVVGCVVNVFLGIAVGVNILSARSYGAGDTHSTKEFGKSAIALSLIFGIVFFILGHIIAEPLLELIGIDPVIRGKTLTYIRVYLFGVPFSALYNFISSYLRGLGETTYPTATLIISGAVNVILNVVFVKYLKMGVAGVALATAISTILSFVMIFVYYLKHPYGSRIKDIRLDKRICNKIIALGLPTGLQSLIAVISCNFGTAAINTFGAAALAGEAIQLQMESLLSVGFAGLNAAIITFVSQNFGAGNYKRLNTIYRVSFTFGIIYALAGSFIAYSLRHPFVNMFAHGDMEVTMYALKKINCIILPYTVVAILHIPSCMLRGIGGTFEAMLLSVGGCIYRICWILLLFPLPTFHSIEFIFISYPIEWIVSGIISAILYNNKKKKLLTT